MLYGKESMYNETGGSIERTSITSAYLTPTVNEKEKNFCKKCFPLLPPLTKNRTNNPTDVISKYNQMLTISEELGLFLAKLSHCCTKTIAS